jgi:hypothetical protein
LNCNKDSVETILNHPKKPNEGEVSFSQNILDNLGVPNELVFQMGNIK